MRHSIIAIASAAIAIATSSAASAHHVADGAMPSSIAQAVLSGIAHPVIELDHLAFVVAIGIAAALLVRGWRIGVGFVAAVVMGVILQAARAPLPSSEFLVATSLVIAGLSLVASRIEHPKLWIGLSALAGLIHGHALAQSIDGASSAIAVGYGLGLVIGLTLLIAPIGALVQWLRADEGAIVLPVRAAGGAVAALGVFFAASALIGA